MSNDNMYLLATLIGAGIGTWLGIKLGLWMDGRSVRQVLKDLKNHH